MLYEALIKFHHLQISVVLSAVLGTIIYRISLVSVIYGGGGFFVKEHAKLFTTVTAALINLVVIMILTRVGGAVKAMKFIKIYIFILFRSTTAWPSS